MTFEVGKISKEELMEGGGGGEAFLVSCLLSTYSLGTHPGSSPGRYEQTVCV